MKTQNLFIIGSQKSGTSALHAYVDAHPDIQLATVKETFFFSHDRFYENGTDWYIKTYFDSSATYVGESSTSYTMSPLYPGVAKRIFEFNPDSKLLYIMRDPVSRAISSYWHEVSRMRESKSMEMAILEDSQYIATSNYAMQIKEYLRYFDLSAIKFLTLEELRDRPDETLNEIFGWLNLPDHVVDFSHIVHNATPTTIQALSSNAAINELRKYTSKTRFVKNFVPASMKNWGRKILNRSMSRDEPKIRKQEQATINKIRPILLDMNKDMELICQRQFNQWEVLNDPL